MKFQTLLLPFAFCLLASSAACHRSAAPPGTPTITLRPADGPRPSFVEVSGLGADALSSLRDARLAVDRWQALLRISVDDESAPSVNAVQAVEGRYAVTESSVTFTPAFPFDPGRAYRVAFAPARLPRAAPLPVVTTVVRLAAIPSQPSVRVTAVYPAGEILPENTLRLYIEFSAPMGNSGALDFVRLVDAHGRDVDIPFLPVQADFWNAGHTRYTLFFDPGRVKLGILPNEQLGRPLRAGHIYTLQIATGWRDAHGQPLEAAYRREFRVGPAQPLPIAPASWRIAPPAARTRDPLIVTFPGPLDHGLLARALSVEGRDGRAVAGEIAQEAADTRWLFRPATEWKAGEYQLVALSILEDPAGNRIGRAFEVDMTKTAAKPTPDAYRLPFKVAEPRF